MRLLGVTGTNGKTTCAWWLAHLLQGAGGPAGIIGTLGYGVCGGGPVSFTQTRLTTPDASTLRDVFREFTGLGVKSVAMEVSSHGLELGRVRDCRFSTALFTNLSRDHLDFHGDMRRYGAAKERLFVSPGLRNAVINVDDAFGAELAMRLRERARAPRVLTYSAEGRPADVSLRRAQYGLEGVSAAVHSPWGDADIRAPVIGPFNAANLLGVFTVLCAEGIPFEAIVPGLESLTMPPGRLQRVCHRAVPITVFVDYAHTPSALEGVLKALRSCSSGVLWCVFGCGGRRDRGKRPRMGEIVSRLADGCFVTSDNPRDEEPAAIIREIVAGMPSAPLAALEDRRQAIREGVLQLPRGGLLLVAGKGHERYQDIDGQRRPFDDVLEVMSALDDRSARDETRPGGGDD